MPELADAQRSILVIIDLQGKLVGMVHRADLVLAATDRLLRLAEMFAVPVVLTEQYPKGLGPTHPKLLERFDSLSVPRRRIDKTLFGCCGDAGFDAALDELRPGLPVGRRQLIVAGIEAHVCVMQTVLGARARGEAVQLCWDAVSGRGEEHRRWALERMQQAGAQITNTESVGFEWARDKSHPRFRDLSELIKEGLPGAPHR